MTSTTPALSTRSRTTHGAPTQRLARAGLLVTEAFVALTAIAGGSVLIIGALLPEAATVMSPPEDYLIGTPFESYLVPGLLLAIVVGGLHAAAFVLELTRNAWHLLAATTAGFAVLIWIFVQMVFIPFSFLQAVYFVAGLVELGLVQLALGVTRVSAAGS